MALYVDVSLIDATPYCEKTEKQRTIITTVLDRNIIPYSQGGRHVPV
jgi:hypothetical protein